jgi:hypothetical protein
VVGTVICAENKASNESTHQRRSLGVVSQRNKDQYESEHDSHGSPIATGMAWLSDTIQNVAVEDFREHEDSKGSSQAKESKGAGNRDDHVKSGCVLGSKGLQLGKDNHCNIRMLERIHENLILIEPGTYMQSYRQ